MRIRVYFLGSGAIGVNLLRTLYRDPRFSIVGVGTQKDKRSGRGRRISPTPIAQAGEDLGIVSDKIDSVNREEFINYLRELNIDILLLFSFGQIIVSKVLNLPKVAPVNVHASLLPKYRGASPIAAAILNGDDISGITFMKMIKRLDAGAIYFKRECPLKGDERYDQLEERLGTLAAESTGEILYRIYNGDLAPIEQDENMAIYTRKIKKEDGAINWYDPSIKIERMCRAYYVWPGAYFYLYIKGRNRKMLLREARTILDYTGEVEPGKILVADKRRWIVGTGEGALEIVRVVPEGKREMSGTDFIRGVKLEKGMSLIYG